MSFICIILKVFNKIIQKDVSLIKRSCCITLQIFPHSFLYRLSLFSILLIFSISIFIVTLYDSILSSSLRSTFIPLIALASAVMASSAFYTSAKDTLSVFEASISAPVKSASKYSIIYFL